MNGLYNFFTDKKSIMSPAEVTFFELCFRLRRTLIHAERYSTIRSRVLAIRKGCIPESWLRIAESYSTVQECDATEVQFIFNCPAQKKIIIMVQED